MLIFFFSSVALKDATRSNRLWGSGFVLTGRIFCYICLNMFYLPKYVEFIFCFVLESGGFPVPEGPRTCAK